MTDHDSMITSYQYDDLYQLEKVTNDSGTVTYDYDPVGNRITMTDTVGSTTYSHDDANQLTDLNGPAGTTNFGYDSNGNLISKSVGANITHYAYDPENRLTDITYPDSSTNSFVYDPNGKRVKRTAGGETVNYLYDGWNVGAEIDSTEAVKQTYLTGMTLDDVFGMSQGGTAYYYLKDGLGSVTGISDSTQQIVKEYAYDAYGSVTEQTGSVDNEITTLRYIMASRGVFFSLSSITSNVYISLFIPVVLFNVIFEREINLHILQSAQMMFTAVRTYQKVILDRFSQ